MPPKKVTNRVNQLPSQNTSEVAIEEQDCTGDSGMGTGSGSDQYGGLEEWKNAMQDPPPESEHSYQPLRRETTDNAEGVYTSIVDSIMTYSLSSLNIYVLCR